MIAGHIFTLAGQCACGRRFEDISGAELSDVGRLNLAHQGSLTADAFQEIVAERERIWNLVAGVANGGAGSVGEAASL
jgi:hypothetical protein